MGCHFGVRPSKTASTLSYHTDMTNRPSDTLNQWKEAFVNGGFTSDALQSAIHLVTYASEITEVPVVKITSETGEVHYEYVRIDRAIRWYKWLTSELSDEERALFETHVGSKFDWPKEWVSEERFLQFANYDKTPNEIIVIRSPPPELIECAIPGEEWVEGKKQWVLLQFTSVHRGPHGTKAPEGETLMRITVYTTEPDEEGCYTSDRRNTKGSKGLRSKPAPGQFTQRMSDFAEEVGAEIQSSWGKPADMLAWFNANTGRLLAKYTNGEVDRKGKGYPLQCMGGMSHDKYLLAFILIMKHLPTTNAMLAHLYHAPTFEVEQNYTPGEYNAKRTKLLDAQPKPPRVNYLSVCRTLGKDEAEMAHQMVKVGMKRLHYCLKESSGQPHLPMPESVEKLYSGPYKRYRKGPHWDVDKINLPHCSMVLTDSGFGLFGNVHMRPDLQHLSGKGPEDPSSKRQKTGVSSYLQTGNRIEEAIILN